MRNPVVKAGLCQLSYGYLRLLDKTVRLKTEFPAEMDRAGYSRAFSIKKRWDHYKIPLPFTTITVTAEKFGIGESEKTGKAIAKFLKNTLQSGI